jgi:hypothetical protein
MEALLIDAEPHQVSLLVNMAVKSELSSSSSS